MTLSTKRLRLSRSEQSTETAATDRASKSVENPERDRKGSVPSIINDLYSAPDLYPGDDPRFSNDCWKISRMLSLRLILFSGFLSPISGQ